MIASEQGVPATKNWGPPALEEMREARRKQQDATAGRRDGWIRSNRYFYDRLKRVWRFIVEPRKRVLDVRWIKDTLCGTKVLWRKDWVRMEQNLGTWGIRTSGATMRCYLARADCTLKLSRSCTLSGANLRGNKDDQSFLQWCAYAAYLPACGGPPRGITDSPAALSTSSLREIMAGSSRRIDGWI